MSFSSIFGSTHGVAIQEAIVFRSQSRRRLAVGSVSTESLAVAAPREVHIGIVDIGRIETFKMSPNRLLLSAWDHTSQFQVLIIFLLLRLCRSVALPNWILI